jgi:hypothetical protein
MQLTTTKFRIGFIKYDVHATCLVYYLFFLDRQFRGDVAIQKFNRKIVEIGKFDIPNTHIHDRSLF